MNGMTRKKQQRDHARRYTADGLPRDARDWTEDDWRALHEAMETAKAKVRSNHERRNEDNP